MNILFHLGHPAHFHLFKNVIDRMNSNGHSTTILIKKKDILEDLLKKEKLPYTNILIHGRKDNKLGMIYGQLMQEFRMLKFCLKNKQDLLVGTSSAITHVGKVLGIPSIIVTEDDAEITPLVVKVAYPWATLIVTPEVCSVGKWKHKQITYSSYHELAYLHPNHFKPDRKVVEKYFSLNQSYFIIRLAKLTAHHDKGITGITNEITSKLIELLKGHGKIFITSERKLARQFEKYRISINPIDMHHVLAFSSLYIGDSQTMAAEAGVLGVPFIRFNDFVGEIGYLNELENKYKLGYGILTKDVESLYEKVKELVNTKDLIKQHQERRNLMLNEKIDLALFLTWFFENYPNSSEIIKENPKYQYNIK